LPAGKTLSDLIKAEASRLGFADCGITSAGPLIKDRKNLVDWLQMGYHGEMQYLENNPDIRTDPRNLLRNAASVILVLQNYYTPEKQKDPSAPVISKYAYGRDYHKIIRKKITRLLEFIQNELIPCNGRIFVDSSPVLERSLANRAGLGWIGKNSLLISRHFGSYFFIGGIIVDVELAYDKPVKDYCGKCTRCMDECPTQAIIRPRIIDSRRCVSYLTIEYKGITLPRELKGRFRNRVFGCDICQDVCPWNKNARAHNEKELYPPPLLLEMTASEWYELNEERYNHIFTGSAVKRLKYNGLKRNLEFLRMNQSGSESDQSGFDLKSGPD
jgi:epoxyqueuosine reductase